MSKTPRSSSRTHSRSASRSRSRSDSRSCSRSRSSSHSRSRKHRYGSRSRSRSRSHSPFHNRGRKHPREYQHQREFRGYHRGFRRPYYFRGRGRGFFRGRFQRGGGGYNNYRSNNWQNYCPYPQQKQQKQQKQQQAQPPQQQKQYAHSPKRGRSRTPKKRSSSPGSLSHSHRSDRSSSLHSHHSSSSSSSRKITASAKQNSKAGIEILSASKESQTAGGEDATDATLSVKEGHYPEQGGSTSGEKVPKTWLFPVNQGNSPKMSSPQIHSTNSAVQDKSVTGESGPVPVNSGATGNGAINSQTVASTASNRSFQKKSPTAVFSGFGLFSNADQEEDTIAISLAFKKFLEEQKNKKQSLTDKSMETVSDNGNSFPENRNSKCEDAFDQSSAPKLSRSSEQNNKKESERIKYTDNSKENKPSIKFRPAILLDNGEEEEGEDTEPHLKMSVVENEVPDRKSKVTMSARELFEEHFRRLDNRACDDELEAFLINREKERAASILSALSKREKFARKFEDLSPDRPSKVKRKDKMTSSPSPTYKVLSRSSSETQEQEINLGDESPPRASGKREREFSLRMDSLSEDLARSSVLSNDWKDTMDLVHCNKKEFQQRWCNNLCRSPKELFAQHVISIVHYVTAQHFSSSGMTLSDRFTMYQRLAAEKEMMKPRKSPEIHRRIDVSPSAFKRHSFLFDELKGSGESSSKAEIKQFKGDKVDLPMNVEQRKKYLSRDTNEKQEEQRELGNSPESSMESSMEKSSKHHKKAKKGKKKRERSHSSSSSSSSSSLVHEERMESTEKSSAQLQVRECVGSAETRQAHRGFQFRIRGRGWNRVNCLGNDSKCTNNAPVPSFSNNMDWDSEQRATSKKYYLPDEKYVEGERKWANTRGRGQSAIPRVRGRFILRRPIISITTNNSNWSHDKFKASGDNGEPGKRDHNEQNNA